jgi:hypothetical protein
MQLLGFRSFSDIITLTFSQSRRHEHMIVLSIIARHRTQTIADSSSRKIRENYATYSRKKNVLVTGCATTWPAVRRRVALRSSIAGVAFRADGCLPSGGRARSESVSASCAMVGPGQLGTINWADRLAILTLDACHVQTPLQNGRAGAQSDSHIFAIDGLPLQPSDTVWR